eukprot:CAMPEP_0179911068 /NCGR_PEP_ID=MMETSP0982-20121206/46131_1 /TAXON_ID=483367 /ORGANISM="non described non described, Strain CCMP 2436" /LENGTH=122 /DNA_ID=CAMNT_0021812719 /DNA_START=511 /DNA_END=876 /DNA_ORIENTATION=-
MTERTATLVSKAPYLPRIGQCQCVRRTRRDRPHTQADQRGDTRGGWEGELPSLDLAGSDSELPSRVAAKPEELSRLTYSQGVRRASSNLYESTDLSASPSSGAGSPGALPARLPSESCAAAA